MIALPIANGFLPTRGSMMLDFVFVAIFLVAAVLAWSIYLVRVRKNYALHKKVQIVLALVVLVTLVAFEVDIRFFTDWRALAAESPLFESGWVDRILWIHLAFAIPTPFLWIITIVLALKRFPNPPEPNEHSRVHRRWGWASAMFLFMTVITGIIFYIAGFAM